MHRFKLTNDTERPCYVIGMIDGLNYTPKRNGFEVEFHENGQTRTTRHLLN